MYKFGKAIAVALAATMVFGSAITSFATEPVTSVDSTGEGSSEGHVDRKTIDIELPTQPATSPFKYIMDPERLIAETSAKKYPNTVWPASSADTGVYFNEGAIEDGDDAGKVQYGKDSIVTTITNKSSHKLNITVKAEAVSAATDIPLVESDAYASAEVPSLYLGLVVGDEDAAPVLKDTAAVTTVEVAGTSTNYKVDWNATDSKYEFRKLTLEEFQNGDATKTQADYDATWKTTTFNLEGGVTAGKEVATGVTAPQVKVTWSWADPEATPATPTITAPETYSRAETANVFTLANIGDLEITGVVSYLADGTTRTSTQISSEAWSVNAAKTQLIVDGSKAPFGAGAVGQTRGLGVVLSDETEIKITFEVNE